jgi:hypothetical protein
MSIGPIQFEKFIRTIQTELNSLKEAAQQQIAAVHDTAQAGDQKEAEIGASIADAIHAAADTVPDYEKTQRKKEHSVQWAIFWVTLAGALFAATAAGGAWYYAGIAAHQARTMQDTYTEIRKQTAAFQSEAWAARDQVNVSERGSRPFVGIELISARYSYEDNGAVRESDSPVPSAYGMMVTVTFKNYGPLPGLSFRTLWKVTIGSKSITHEKTRNGAINPGGVQGIQIWIGGKTFQSIMNGEESLTGKVQWSYTGPEGTYQECNYMDYDEPTNTFLEGRACRPTL